MQATQPLVASPLPTSSRHGSARIHPAPPSDDFRPASPAVSPQQQFMNEASSSEASRSSSTCADKVLCGVAAFGAVGVSGGLTYVATLPFVGQALCIVTTGVATGIVAEGSRRVANQLCPPEELGTPSTTEVSRELEALRGRVSVLEQRDRSGSDDRVQPFSRGVSKDE